MPHLGSLRPPFDPLLILAMIIVAAWEGALSICMHRCPTAHCRRSSLRALEGCRPDNIGLRRLRGGSVHSSASDISIESPVCTNLTKVKARWLERPENSSLPNLSGFRGDMWLEHAIAREESGQLALAPQISLASPFLPLMVAHGGLDAVTLLQRRMLLDSYEESCGRTGFSPTSESASSPCRTESQYTEGSTITLSPPNLRIQRDAAEARAEGMIRASSPRLIGSESIIAMQVNGWESLIANVSYLEQRNFVQLLSMVEVDEMRQNLLLEFCGKLGRVVLEEWEHCTLSIMDDLLQREAPKWTAQAELQSMLQARRERTEMREIECVIEYCQIGDRLSLPQEFHRVHEICTCLLNFNEDVKARLPSEAAQRYIHVEIAKRGWESLIALLQHTPIGQNIFSSDTVVPSPPWCQYPSSERHEAFGSSIARGDPREDAKSQGGEKKGVMRRGEKSRGIDGGRGPVLNMVFESAAKAGAFGVIHQALGDCYWHRRIGTRFHLPLVTDLENNLLAAFHHYTRAARVFTPAYYPKSYRTGLAQALIGAGTTLLAKRQPLGAAALGELEFLAASDQIPLFPPEMGVRGMGNLAVATRLLRAAVTLLDDQTDLSTTSKKNLTMSPDWIQAQFQLAVCLARSGQLSVVDQHVHSIIERAAMANNPISACQQELLWSASCFPADEVEGALRV